MLYFGYGSNLNPVALRAKGVEPLESQPALVHGWRLEFSVTPPFPSQGGMATIVQTDDPVDVVHGVLHRCEDSAFVAIDTFEARGIFYERIEVEAAPYSGGAQRACAYVVLPRFHDRTLRPTRRYLDMLLNGASTMRLDAAYVDRLRLIETLEPRIWPPFEHPAEPARSFNAQSLVAADRHVALLGAVFDMSAPSWKTAFLVPMWSGKDVSLFLLKMLDPTLGTEMLERIRRDELDAQQRNHLTGYLHEFAAAFRYAGRYEYD